MLKNSNNCQYPLSSSPQCLEESGAWQRVNTQVPIRSPRYAVFDLAEGKQYRFRVMSANMYGCSEPSEPTGPIETQELKGVFPSFSFLWFFFQQQPDERSVCLQVCPPLPVRWLLPGKQTHLSSSSGLRQKSPTIWLATTSISVWKDPKPGLRPITNPTRTPSITKIQHSFLLCSEMCFLLKVGWVVVFACDCRFVVSGLTKGETYMFRVQAINELGLSDESQESAPISVLAALSESHGS